MSSSKTLLKIWQYSKKSQIGRILFSKVLGFVVPYSSTVRPLVDKIQNGESIITVKDRRAIRNHLGSIHAIALANIGELASGLAVLSILPDDARGIVKSLDIRFSKKARGKITAHGSVSLPAKIEESLQASAKAVLYDSSGEVVSEVTVIWQIGPNLKA